MKYENFEKAQSLVASIDKETAILSQLQNSFISVRIQTNSNHIVTVGAYDGCQHPLQPMIADFIVSVKADYQTRIDDMYKDLELL